jgi:N-acetylmuramoyl-L-alanine amidase
MKLTVLNSPNQNHRPPGVRPRVIVIHADAAISKDHRSSINWIMNPAADVSYHAIIGRDGSITQLVPDDRRAWHCGVSSYGGVHDVNDFSIGICFSNLNDGREPYTPAAILAGVDLCVGKMKQWAIPPENITTHALIALPKGRKTDPGPAFPLDGFITAVRNRLTCTP